MTANLDDQAIKELCSLRPDLTEEMIREFDEALTSFVNSPRFQVMKPLLLKRFLEKDMEKEAFEAMDEELHALTLGELPDLGTLELCLKPGMSVTGISVLTTLLKALGSRAGGAVEGEEYMDPLHSIPVGIDIFPEDQTWDHDVQDTMPSGLFSRPGGQTLVPGDTLPNEANTVSSIEEESILKDTLAALKASDYFRHFRRDKVGDYWDLDGLRAPFLESMTWEQLVSMETSILMQKRIYNQRKTFGILEAARKVLLQYDDTSVRLPGLRHEEKKSDLPARSKKQTSEPMVARVIERATEVHSTQRNTPQLSKAAYPEIVPWSESMPCVLWPYYALSVEMLRRLHGQEAPLVRLIAALHQELRVEALLMGMLLPSSGEALLKSMICANQECSSSVEETAAQWCSLAEAHAPELSTALKTALAAPLVDEESLLRPFMLDDVPHRYQRMILLGLVFSLGGRPAAWRKESCASGWTRAPKTLGLVMQELEGSLPLSEDEMKALCDDLLPSLSYEHLRPWFLKLFVYEAASAQWSAHKQH